MPRLSVWIVRTALAHLGVGVTLGAAILAAKGLPGWRVEPPAGGAAWPWWLLGAHVEVVLVGWLVQFALGVAYWILPRRRIGGRPARGREAWAAAAFGLINVGVLAVVAGGLAADPRAVAMGRVLEALAVAAFAVHAWPRVRPAGSNRAAPAGDRGDAAAAA